MYTVLLVDDEEMVTQGLSRFVPWEDTGFTVAGTASSADKALAFLEKTPVDLVITDITMPVTSGLSLIASLNEKHPGIKTVILSGYSDFNYAQQAIRLGALDYLTKPINFGAIRSVLERVRAKLDEESQRSGSSSRLQEVLTHAVILNICNGLPFEQAKAALYLDTTCPITAVRISCLEKQPLPEDLHPVLSQSMGACQMVSPAENEILCVLEGSRSQSDVLRSLQALAEQACVGGFHMCIGVSQQFQSYADLRMASLQAAKAMRYQKARNSSGVTPFRTVREMYLNTKEAAEAQITRLASSLSSPDSRATLVRDFTAALTAMETRPDFSFTMARQFCTELLMELDTPLQDLVPKDYPHHTYLSEALMDVLSARNLHEIREYMVGYLQKLLQDLSQLDEAQNAVELIDRVKKYIQTHFAENLTLSVLSEIFFVCPAYLSRLFKKKTGINFVDYLTNLRMEKAKEFLAIPSLKVYTVAEMVGYENPRYFSRLFKDSTGISPQEYRSAVCSDAKAAQGESPEGISPCDAAGGQEGLAVPHPMHP